MARRPANEPGAYPLGNETALAEYWGGECARALRQAIQRPEEADGVYDHHLLHAIRSARSAASHAFKSRPSIAPLDGYAQAVADYRQKQKEEK